MTVEDVLARLDGVRSAGSGSVARCPAHEDRRQSLSVRAGDDGRVLLNCHAGCSAEAIVSALGVKMADLFADGTERAKPREEAAYDYRDEAGRVLYQVVRFFPKDFRQRRPDGAGGWIWNLQDTRRVLYRLPELQGQRTVVVVEGEKDVDRLRDLGIVATTSVGGAGKWRPDYAEQLAAAGVEELVIVPDNDNPGRAHASQVAKSWQPRPVRLVTLPGVSDKGDVSDYLATHAADDLRALLAPPPPVVDWLDSAAQFSITETEDREAAIGRRVFLALPRLDETIGGVRRGEVLGLMARPGTGKTLVLTHAAYALAELDDVGHVCFSLEMPAAQIVGRLQQQLYHLGRNSREDASRDGSLDGERYRRFFRSLLIVDRPGLSVEDMGEILTRIMAGPFKDRPLGLVTIDHLGLIGGDRKLSTYDRVSVQAREVKELAKRFGCAVLLAVQVNRDSGGDGSKELTLGSARDSGVVEEAMDYLVGLRRFDRSPLYDDNVRRDYYNILFGKVIKNRHGDPDADETAYRLDPIGLRLEEHLRVQPPGDSVTDIAKSLNARRGR